MYDEDDLLPISALQHLLFCERQCALIYLEGVWEENRLTAEGRVMHERAHEADSEWRGDVRIARGLRVRSLRLGLTGQCDVVEFRQVDRVELYCGAGFQPADHGEIAGRMPAPQQDTARNRWSPFPIEYKRGRPKREPWDEVQLCAQAMCLEEMIGVAVRVGAIFYGKTRRRHHVRFDAVLRGETERAAARLHELFRAGVTPRVEYEKKCDNCSLVNVCMPKTTGGGRRASRYLARASAGVLYEEHTH
jgi:CRISPR-associated exonuclease Cas4